uniref:Essential protein Yae1 N-terminal domain-containing protein n=1 Tax=Ammonifex degensii TaxID=42838 RepID=A0A7C2EJR0_9THEO
MTINRREGFRVGWRVGYNQGYAEGFETGYEAGFEEGKGFGYNEGCADALCLEEEVLLALQRLKELLSQGEVKFSGSAAPEICELLHKLGGMVRRGAG